jgi:acyl-coenzyme A synthetase/AMP-(fatty) acid ligase
MQTFADTRYVRNRKIYPEKTPILGSSYVTITYVDSAGTTQTLATSDYIVSYRDNPSCISEAYSATWPDTRNYENDVTVTYTVGTTATPVTVKHAVNMLVGHWYNNREAMSDKSMQDVPLGFLALVAPEMIERYG